MTIGALLLQPRHAIAQGIWAMLLYTVLAVGEQLGWIAPHYDFLPQFPSPNLYARGEFVAAKLMVMAAGVFAMLYFALHITGRLEQRERELLGAHAALRKSRDALADLQQRRARLLQTAAHQLKGPLASIETLAGLLVDRIVPPDAVASTYAKIRQRCREGAVQVAELLTLARVQRSDPGRHARCLTDAARVAREVCARYAPLAESKGINLDLHVPDDVQTIALVDPADLTDCLSNLVDNAIKFSAEPGTVTVSVALGTPPWRAGRAPGAPELAGATIGAGAEPTEAGRSAEDSFAEAEQVIVTVSDHGLGLDEQSLAEITHPEKTGSVFDAFRRGNNALAAAVPGTGLGLAIVREVVEQSGGRILVRSRPGHGSSFTVTFPTHEASAERAGIRDTRSSIVVLPVDEIDEHTEAPAEAHAEPADARLTTV
jgi:two-component system phosphate regulon sensor histidine kinase PhoR